jgi:hypothetical protein
VELPDRYPGKVYFVIFVFQALDFQHEGDIQMPDRRLSFWYGSSTSQPVADAPAQSIASCLSVNNLELDYYYLCFVSDVSLCVNIPS